jgi:HK97 family phage major capsid protein
MSEIKEIIETLEPKIKGFKEELAADVAKLDSKLAADVAQLNEDAAKKSETLGELKAKVDALAAKNGKMVAGAIEKAGWNNSDFMKSGVMDIVAENFDSIRNEKPFSSQKIVGNMTMIDNLTGTSQVSYVQNPIMRSFFNPHLYDVFRIVPTATGNVTFPRGKSPVGEGSFGAQTEGSAKAQVDYDVEMVNVSVPFIAGYARVSRQMLQDLPFLQSYLSQSLIEDWNRAVNVRFLNSIATNSTALSTSQTLTVAKMIDGIAQHGNLSVPASVAVDQSGAIRINGIPVVPHSQVTGSRFYVMNTNAFGIAQASGLQVRSTEFNEDDFVKNLITYRAEARIELLAFQPTAAVYGATGTAS